MKIEDEIQKLKEELLLLKLQVELKTALSMGIECCKSLDAEEVKSIVNLTINDFFKQIKIKKKEIQDELNGE